MEIVTHECIRCGEPADEESPYMEGEDPICDDCYRDNYQEYCPLCEEYYDKPENPEDTYFVVTKTGAPVVNVEHGVYQATDWPVSISDIFGGNISLLGNHKLLRKCDVMEMKRKLGHKPDLEGGDYICPCCAGKYTQQSGFFSIRAMWTKNMLHRNIFERGVIQNGY